MKRRDDFSTPRVYEFSDLLCRIYDAPGASLTNTAVALHIPVQSLYQQLADERQNSLRATVQMYDQCVRDENPLADLIITEPARSRGFVAFRLDAVADSTLSHVGHLVRQTAEVMEVTGERSTDGVLSLDDKKAVLKELRDLPPILMAAITKLETDIAAEEKRRGDVRSFR